MAAWRVPAEIADLSVRVAEFYHLDLASLWWSTGGRQPRLARIDGWHWDGALGPQLAPLCEAVAEWMAEKLAQQAHSVAMPT